MKNFVTAILSTLILGTTFSIQADDLVKTVVTGCEAELTQYCAQVTPGEGRGLACLYAHGDKLSGQCEYALYDASAQLERFVSALSYLVHECADDVQAQCADVQAGEGRLAQCLLDNKASLTPRCSSAIDATNLSVE